MVNVSRQFLDDFNTVIGHYNFTNEEIKDAKEAVRKDYELAKKGYKETAGYIRLFYPKPVIEEKSICVSEIQFNGKKDKSASNKRRV